MLLAAFAAAIIWTPAQANDELDSSWSMVQISYGFLFAQGMLCGDPTPTEQARRALTILSRYPSVDVSASGEQLVNQAKAEYGRLKGLECNREHVDLYTNSVERDLKGLDATISRLGY